MRNATASTASMPVLQALSVLGLTASACATTATCWRAPPIVSGNAATIARWPAWKVNCGRGPSLNVPTDSVAGEPRSFGLTWLEGLLSRSLPFS